MKVAAWVVGVLVASGCVEATPSETSQRTYFQGNVQPILIAKCAHSGCHGAGNADANFVAFDVYSYDSLAARFDLLEPGKPYAKLLTKAAGIEAHAGGTLLDVGSDAFFVLQAWLDNGATDE